MTSREAHDIAAAINERYRTFDPDGSVRFGIEEAVYAICDAASEENPLFDATDFKSRCFGGEVRA